MDQVYAMDMDSKVWQPVEIYGELRPSIAHGAAAQKNLICVFGGHSGNYSGRSACIFPLLVLLLGMAHASTPGCTCPQNEAS